MAWGERLLTQAARGARARLIARTQGRVLHKLPFANRSQERAAEPSVNFNEQKRALVETLLALCPFVAIDATQPGVAVPEVLRQPDLVLRLGRDPRVMGMPDLVLDDVGFRVTISLRGVRHYVSIPWEACSRCWIGEPFAGPIIVWPEAAQAPKAAPASRPPALRIVKKDE